MLLVHVGGAKTSAVASAEIREKQLKRVKDRLGRGILNTEPTPSRKDRASRDRGIPGDR